LKEIDIQQADNGKKGMFYIGEHHATVTEMTYVWSGNKIIIDHTSVDETLQGQNIGKRLVDSAVQFARAKEIKIFALCPFAKSVFDKNPEYADVLF